MSNPTAIGLRERALLAAALVLTAMHSIPAAAGPALLFEPRSGKVLYAEDADNQWHPASLTKIMTAYLTFEAMRAGKITLATKIPVSEKAAQQPPSKVGLPVGAEMSLEVALKALIIKSANDVAVMLAEGVGGSEAQFIDRMNATAKRLGMTRTHFVNPNGLPAAGQVTTARDLARLSRAVLRDFPEHAHYWSMQDARIGDLHLTSHNGLLKKFEGADGLKTGFICDSGFNVVGSATREGRKLIAIVLGETSGVERTVRAASLLEHGFQTWGWKAMFAKATIDSMALAPTTARVTTMRDIGIKWECGARKPVRRVAKGKGRGRAKGKADATAAKSAPGAPKAKARAAAIAAPPPKAQQ